MSGNPVVVLWAGVVSFFFDADLGDAAIYETYLPWGPVHGGLISWVLLAADTLLVFECLDSLLDGPAVGGHPF